MFTVSVGLQTAALVITCFIFGFKCFVIWSIKLYSRSGLVTFSVLSKPEQASAWRDFASFTPTTWTQTQGKQWRA